jgi:hypothetical protein
MLKLLFAKFNCTRSKWKIKQRKKEWEEDMWAIE